MINEFIFFGHILFIGVTLVISAFFNMAGLCTFVTLQAVAANIFVIKQTMLCGLTTTCAEAFAVGSTFGLALIQEYHGLKAARTALIITVINLIFWLGTTQIHCAYACIGSNVIQNAYVSIFSHTPRLIFASFTAFTLSQAVNYSLMYSLSRVCGSRYPLVRTCISVTISQCLDTVLFAYWALSNVVKTITPLIISSCTIKLITIACIGPFMYCIRPLLRKTFLP